jgi:hypothetical protein
MNIVTAPARVSRRGAATADRSDAIAAAAAIPHCGLGVPRTAREIAGSSSLARRDQVLATRAASIASTYRHARAGRCSVARVRSALARRTTMPSDERQYVPLRGASTRW